MAHSKKNVSKNHFLDPVFIALGTSMLSACVSQYNFQSTPKAIEPLGETPSPVDAIGVYPVPTPSPSTSPIPDNSSITIKDKHIPVEFNQPLDLQLGNEPNEWVLNLSNDEKSMLDVRIKDLSPGTGEIKLVDAATHKYQFIPTTGFRGEIDIPYTVRSKSGKIISNEARLVLMVGSSIQTLKPALAIRATGCIMCHAVIKANLITDFGYGGDGNGNDYFFGRIMNGFTPASGNIYGDHGAWETASITGTVTVPKAQISAPNSYYVSGATLLDFLKSKQVANPNVTFQEVDKVFIGVPKAESFIKAAGEFPVAHPSWKYIPHTSESVGVGSITEKASYFEISGDKPFTCAGDLVLKKPLVLRGTLNLSTDDTGCRIYSIGTIFVQGGINYLGEAPLRNLQLMSTRAILMGLGQNVTEIKDGNGNGMGNQNSIDLRFNFWTSQAYFKRGIASPLEANNAILADAKVVDGLIDAESLPGGRTQGFSRILLVAPQVDSRFQGDISGTIIAEVAMFSLNKFKFTFDEVFSKAPVFPLVRSSEYLNIGTSTSQ